MKSLIFTFTLLLSTALAATVSIDPIDLIIKTDPTSQTVIVRTTTAVSMVTRVELIDARNNVLHDTDLDSGEYLNVRFHLSAVAIGEYTLVVSDRRGQTRQPVTVSQRGVYANTDKAIREFYPRIQLSEDKLLTVNYLNTAGKKVAIRLNDANGHDVLTERVRTNEPVQRAYQLDKLPHGEYLVTVSSPATKSYTTSISLE